MLPTSPGVSFVSLHGHNITQLAGSALTLRSSTDNFGSSDTLEATLVIRRDAFYALLPAAVTRRYWRLNLALSVLGAEPTAQTSPIYYGELVLSAPVRLQQAPGYPSRRRSAVR